MTRIFKIAILLLALCFNTALLAQSEKQKQLEAKRQQLQKDLTKINNLLFSNRKKEKSVLNMVEDLNYKIRVRQNLIEITNEQANLLTREINSNQNQISNLRNQLQQLKDDYAAMIVKSYKSKSQNNLFVNLILHNKIVSATTKSNTYFPTNLCLVHPSLLHSLPNLLVSLLNNQSHL